MQNIKELSKQVQNLLGVHIGQPIYLILNYNGRPLTTSNDTVAKIEISSQNIFIHAKTNHSYNKSFRLGVTAFLTKEERDEVFQKNSIKRK